MNMYQDGRSCTRLLEKELLWPHPLYLLSLRGTASHHDPRNYYCVIYSI